jgi:hypothetical protein
MSERGSVRHELNIDRKVRREISRTTCALSCWLPPTDRRSVFFCRLPDLKSPQPAKTPPRAWWRQ